MYGMCIPHSKLMAEFNSFPIVDFFFKLQVFFIYQIHSIKYGQKERITQLVTLIPSSWTMMMMWRLECVVCAELIWNIRSLQKKKTFWFEKDLGHESPISPKLWFRENFFRWGKYHFVSIQLHNLLVISTTLSFQIVCSIHLKLTQIHNAFQMRFLVCFAVFCFYCQCHAIFSKFHNST